MVKKRRPKQVHGRLARNTRTSRKSRNRRIWIGVGISLAMLLIALLGVLFLRSTDPPTYLEAAQSPQLRKEYIDSKTVDKPPYVLSVKYVDETEMRQKYGDAPVTALMKSEARGIHESDILVFPYAFEFEGQDGEDLFVSMLDHEYRHAEQYKNKKIAQWDFDVFLRSDGSLNDKLLEIVKEVDAYLFQIEKYGYRLESATVASLQNFAVDSYRRLWERDSQDGMDPALIEEFKVELFAGWMLQLVQHRTYFEDGTGYINNRFLIQPANWDGEKELSLQELETGRRYFFTEREASRIAERWLGH